MSNGSATRIAVGIYVNPVCVGPQQAMRSTNNITETKNGAPDTSSFQEQDSHDCVPDKNLSLNSKINTNQIPKD